MQVLVATIGTYGDVQPYVALGKALKAAGHEVTIATADEFKEFVQGHGLVFYPLQIEIKKILHSDKSVDLNTMINPFAVLRRIRKISSALRRHLSESLGIFLSAGDAVILSPFAYASIFFSPQRPLLSGGRIIFMSAMAPGFSPTGRFASYRLTTRNLGKMLNRLSYHIMDFGDYVLNKLFFPAGVNKCAYRQASLLRSIKENSQRLPVLCLYSKYLVPDIDDSKVMSFVGGYCFLDQPKEFKPSRELEDFLNMGEPPIYFGFGSMVAPDPEKQTRRILRALVKSKQRAILSLGWGGLTALKDLPDNVFVVEDVPHSWLFPRMKALVHHGGAGTIAEGLRAGKPTFVCYFGIDQSFWGRRVWELGAGPKPIPYKRITVDKLVHGIRRMCADERMLLRAQELGEQINKEHGVQAACSFLTEHLNTSLAEKI